MNEAPRRYPGEELPLRVSISGLIGAGKTTLAHALGDKMGLRVYEEQHVDSRLLEDFYADQTKHGFHLQISLLNQRFEQAQQIAWSNEGSVQDRSWYEDRVFAKVLMQEGHMSEGEYRTYLRLFRNMNHVVRPPTLIVHLDVTPEESLASIKRRARECEAGIPLSYLEKLRAGYEELLADLGAAVPVIRVRYRGKDDGQGEFPGTEAMVAVIAEQYEKIKQPRRAEVKWSE